ncbi:hypothetical protein DXG01_011424 [Tephrocybe rancida]|nr:hypothetical protein DXG01_011424 [Tephrocybe rancida]
MGIILTITWQYYLNFPNDRFIFKLIVASVFTLSLVDTIVDGYWCYEWSVTSYMQPAIFGVLPILADLGITAGMGYYLRIRLRGQAKGTFNDIISRTIQSNILSLFIQVLSFVLFKANIGLWFFLDDFTAVKVYAFSLIVSMNTRGTSTIYNTPETSETSRPAGISLSQLSSANFRGRAQPASNVSINVRQEVEVEADSWEHSQSFTHHKVDPELALNQDKKDEAY